MKFDPINKNVYTDSGEFIKQLNCPFRMDWDDLEPTSTTYRKCSNCDHFIIDTAYTSDDELLHLVKENPNTCMKIDLNQHNINIISNVNEGQN